MNRKPFYGDRPTSGVVIQAEMLETTRDDCSYRQFHPTGRRRAFIGGYRVPVRVAIWSMVFFRLMRRFA